MIPKDIESGEQFQVRWDTPTSGEVVRTGSKAQMIFMQRSRAEFGAVLERRTITVSAWEPYDPDAPEPEEDDDAE